MMLLKTWSRNTRNSEFLENEESVNSGLAAIEAESQVKH